MIYYFHHPESGCVFRDISKKCMDSSDGNILELTKEGYWKLVNEYKKIKIEDRRKCF